MTHHAHLTEAQDVLVGGRQQAGDIASGHRPVVHFEDFLSKLLETEGFIFFIGNEK